MRSRQANALHASMAMNSWHVLKYEKWPAQRTINARIRPRFRHRTGGNLTNQLRRSASQVPEQSLPVHEPAPTAPDKRPDPITFLPPSLTVTVSEPLSRTLPLMITALSPALTRDALEIRIG